LSDHDLIVITAPSGTGKTTLIRRLLKEVEGIDFSVSVTTRPMRDGETEGEDYHFVDPERFAGMVAAGQLLEWAEVHGRKYGTSARMVDESLARGRDVLLDVDTQGAESIRRLRPEAVLIFIMPPDFETLSSRLRGRGLDPAEDVARRIGNAYSEVKKYVNYDYVVINDTIERALGALSDIVRSRRLLRRRQEEACRRILATFPGF